MSLLQELATLTRRGASVWLHHFPQLTVILGLGWILHTACIMLSATLGTTLDPLPSILFALGVCAQVVSVILAIASLKPSMLSPVALEQRREELPEELPLPTTVFSDEKPVDIAIAVIGPVLAIYAVWQLIDNMIRDGMLWNIMLQGLGNPTWSVSMSPDRFGIYFAVGVGALILRIIWTRIARNRPTVWRAPVVLFEGTWTAMSFFILVGVSRVGLDWMWNRRFYRQAENWWYTFITNLPSIELPWDSTLPETIVQLTTWITETLLPEIWMGVVLPLMWLSVTAMVFGWRHFDVRDLLDRNLRERADAVLNRSRSWRLVSRIDFLFEDFRYKYLPLVHCWRLVWRAGVTILGAFLVISAALSGVSYLVGAAVLELTSRIDPTAAYMSSNLVRDIFLQALFICLYAVTFDRGVKEALDLSRPAARMADDASAPFVPDPSTRLDLPAPRGLSTRH